jgi:muconolactone delta-isomerase
LTAMGALDDRNQLMEEQNVQLDNVDAMLASTEAAANFWRKRAGEYRAALALAQQEVRELRDAVTEMRPDGGAPDNDYKAVKARALLITINSILHTDRSDTVIDNIQRLIQDYWRETDQLRP